MSDHSLPVLFGAVVVVALAILLATGCSLAVNPDVRRLGDGGSAAVAPPARPPPGDGGVCPERTIRCGGLCVDPALDRAHCGGCGRSCETRCISGICR